MKILFLIIKFFNECVLTKEFFKNRKIKSNEFDKNIGGDINFLIEKSNLYERCNLNVANSYLAETSNDEVLDFLISTETNYSYESFEVKDSNLCEAISEENKDNVKDKFEDKDEKLNNLKIELYKNESKYSTDESSESLRSLSFFDINYEHEDSSNKEKHNEESCKNLQIKNDISNDDRQKQCKDKAIIQKTLISECGKTDIFVSEENEEMNLKRNYKEFFIKRFFKSEN